MQTVQKQILLLTKFDTISSWEILSHNENIQYKRTLTMAILPSNTLLVLLFLLHLTQLRAEYFRKFVHIYMHNDFIFIITSSILLSSLILNIWRFLSVHFSGSTLNCFSQINLVLHFNGEKFRLLR